MREQARPGRVDGDGESAILAVGLRKRFGETWALGGVDLDVAPGTVCGLLGPNGAGKTTMVRILTTLLWPEDGYARVAGFDVVREAEQVRYHIGLAGQQAALDELLTGRANLVKLDLVLSSQLLASSAEKTVIAVLRDAGNLLYEPWAADPHA